MDPACAAVLLSGSVLGEPLSPRAPPARADLEPSNPTAGGFALQAASAAGCAPTDVQLVRLPFWDCSGQPIISQRRPKASLGDVVPSLTIPVKGPWVLMPGGVHVLG